jgi:hypothetical protein
MPLFASANSRISKTHTIHPSIAPQLLVQLNPKCTVNIIPAVQVHAQHAHIVAIHQQISYIIHLRYNALVRDSLRSSPARQDQLFLRSLALFQALEPVALPVALVPHRRLAIEARFWCPDLVVEFASLLLVGVFVDTVAVQAWVVAAHDLRVDVFAIRRGAVCAIVARRHVRVAERTAPVCAVGVEFAVDFVLEMAGTLCG